VIETPPVERDAKEPHPSRFEMRTCGPVARYRQVLQRITAAVDDELPIRAPGDLCHPYM
jgi:hypothetical protein